ncbi:MAG: EAL domain-containing protein [Proteobacteria bacterium]|nr:EAL domain-containing protein [Pseudomonadota bacterium]
MIQQILSISMVAVGIILLISALRPVHQICRLDKENRTGWNTLFILIHFFVLGYSTFCYFLTRTSVTFGDFVVSLILFGGSFFVVIVVRLSRSAIDNINRIAALERHNALHDDLTGLPNRTHLLERTKQLILQAKRDLQPLAILVMDLNRFKEINDALGHHYGDFLLQQVAQRLQEVLRESDTLARLGGDEFSVVLAADTEQAKLVSRKISEALQQPFVIEGHSLNIGISIGIASYPEHGNDCDTLLQHADVAMYSAKSTETHYAVYDITQDQFTLNRLMLLTDLREAIRKDEHLYLHFQPKINIKSNRIKGVEALLRWDHPELGMIPPDQFIPLTEQGGIIRSLSKWVLNAALAQQAAWRDAGLDLPVSINLSIKDLQDISVPLLIKDLLKEYQLEPSSLMLEITETSMMLDPDRTYEVISNLHALGVRLSIDDFGTGYSSLAYLKQLPAEELKIDKSFVRNMLKDDNDEVIVRAIIDLAKNMGLDVIAEGVESAKIITRLQELGCDLAQGYHICKPLPAKELEEWLKTPTRSHILSANTNRKDDPCPPHHLQM